MPHKLLATFVFISISLFCSNLWANDSSIGDENGSIIFVQQPDISMDSERLTISEKQIKVEYTFTNTSDKALKIPIAFPMPAHYYGESDHNPLTNFKAFVNGAEIKTKIMKVVLLDGKKDITKQMADYGWNIKKIEAILSYEQNIDVKTLPQKIRQEWFDKDGYPRFTLHDYYVWEQSFPAQSSLDISHTYHPSLGSGVPLELKVFKELYSEKNCMSPSDFQSLSKRGAQFFEYNDLAYILKTGANWKGSIKNFHLIVQKTNPTDQLHLCFDGDLKKTGDRTFEFKTTNYVPQQDLDILFLRPAKNYGN